jgi:hypothetical protein
MNTKDFVKLGVPLGEATRRATGFVAQYVLRGGDTAKLEDEIKAIVVNPLLFADCARNSPGCCFRHLTPALSPVEAERGKLSGLAEFP